MNDGWVKSIDESAREVCSLVRIGRKNPKIVWWNDALRAVIKRMEDTWKSVFGARDEATKERCMEAYREEKR